MYENGIGVERDIKKAISLYKLAAEQGDAVGQRCLATCYFHGDGVDKVHID
jgi:TPR repeat protein